MAILPQWTFHMPANTSRLQFYVTKPQKLRKQNWLQFLFVVKVKPAALKQQVTKYYSQILSKDASFYIYDKPATDIDVVASFCELNLREKFDSFGELNE